MVLEMIRICSSVRGYGSHPISCGVTCVQYVIDRRRVRLSPDARLLQLDKFDHRHEGGEERVG